MPKKFIHKLFYHHTDINRYLLFFLTWILLIYFFPNKKYFNYEYKKGQAWTYKDYYAPFDFGIEKTEAEKQAEKDSIRVHKSLYYKISDSITQEVLHQAAGLQQELAREFNIRNKKLYHSLWLSLTKRYKNPGMPPAGTTTFEHYTIIGNEIYKWDKSQLLTNDNLDTVLRKISELFPAEHREEVYNKIRRLWKPNLKLDEEFTGEMLEQQLSSMLPTKGFVRKGSLLISKSEIVNDETYQKLESVKHKYEKNEGSNSSIWLKSAYAGIIALILLMLYFFLSQYRDHIFGHLSKLSFILFNLLLMTFITVVIIRWNVSYLYMIPYMILPLIIKSFFDARLALFTHVLTIILLGFVVPNGFEFIFIQIIAGIVTIQVSLEISRRAQLFVSVMKITLVYMLSYTLFYILSHGNIQGINLMNLGMFLINGMITVSILNPLIFAFEKVFGLVSDESLREWADTNTKLLRELNEKAPGTFQHSIQVANLAESAAKEIGADALLIRVGALYHDIGKMASPMYFTENQISGVNPHDELSPDDSAEIIIGHVIMGVEIAQKNKLPDRVIDFIRTHHGTTLVYYFYRKAMSENPEEQVDPSEYRYPGPIPYSKETAILMMCDAAEAASKSLKEPTANAISDLIDKIIEHQMNDGQYRNADITFKDIEKIKKVIKKKLNSIYHVRIAYPE